ncbi:actinin-like protein putative [Entamoeba histolytica]|uniref:Actinin-like protein, putative n=2 Tax=Entamoeba histolytica TaxID=5759 RepID=C4M1S6_ENTH1|nr:actinin-like protein, putative [Entamoeba histolytica HM-1:IMSS]EAL49043.2 actinin-like protein, putative [Entamoeba histolytica HM-1:IMSS]GAT95187.1 actinin-like protein putative [Entamoeba histolytica]|eukprot:XP_654429.2 actinin-like protein, putative [Entamoeba histolytica HM-1:IMSS]
MKEEKLNTSVSAENIVDGNRTYILGMVWTMILKYKINANQQKNVNAKEEVVENNALLDWVNSFGLNVSNFSSDWKDGVALVKLTEAVSAGQIKFEQFSGLDNTQMVIDCQKLAYEQFKIPILMDVKDLVCERPDPKSIMTYVSVYKERYEQLLVEKEQKEEQERIAREEQERKQKEEQERLAREEQERLAREEQERLAREEQERLAREEQERKQKEEQERLAREEQERLAREEQERLAREEQERKQKEEQERLAREEQERLAREEQERLAREEQERKQKEEQERLAREEQERKQREEQERLNQQQPTSQQLTFFSVQAAADAWILQNIQAAYAQDPTIQFQWWYPLVQNLSANDFRELQDWFKKIDKDKSGTLELDELLKAKWPKDMKMNNETIKRLMLIFDADNNGSIGFYEFIALYNWVKLCVATFKHFDVDQSGSLDITELQVALPQLGFNLNKQSCDALIRANKNLIGKKKLNQVQFICATSYLAQCRTIYQLTFDTHRDQLDPVEFDKFINLVLGLI